MIDLNNIYIILKETRYPGNIGATTRAMLNFGIKNLILVNPRCSFTDETYARARHSSFIFEKAPIYDNLEEVVELFPIIIGTSRRGLSRLHMRMSPRATAKEISTRFPHVKIGILFGDEKSGLSNEDLEKCAWYIHIPTSPDFESLNLSHSVAIVCYEIFTVNLSPHLEIYKEHTDSEKIEHLFNHMVLFLKKVGFPVRGSQHRVYADLKRLVSSADLRRTDVNLLHGFMRFMEEKYLGGWIEE